MYFMHFFMVKKGKKMGHLRMLCMNFSVDFKGMFNPVFVIHCVNLKVLFYYDHVMCVILMVCVQ